MKAISNISRAGLHHIVNVTVCEDLIEDFDEMIETVGKSGARALSMDTGKPILVDDKTSVDGTGSPKRMAEFFVKYYPILKRVGVNFSIKLAIPFCLLPEDLLKEMVDDGHILAGCQMSRGRGIIVDPKGRLIPCNHLCDIPLGEIGSDFSTAEEFLDFRERKEVNEFFRLVSSYPDLKCKDCSWWKACGGGCKLYWLHYPPTEMINLL